LNPRETFDVSRRKKCAYYEGDGEGGGKGVGRAVARAVAREDPTSSKRWRRRMVVEKMLGSNSQILTRSGKRNCPRVAIGSRIDPSKSSCVFGWVILLVLEWEKLQQGAT
jgi:hypothetical protein